MITVILHTKTEGEFRVSYVEGLSQLSAPDSPDGYDGDAIRRVFGESEIHGNLTDAYQEAGRLNNPATHLFCLPKFPTG